MCRVVLIGREAWWLPARGIDASQGTFSSFILKIVHLLNVTLYALLSDSV